MVLKLGNQPQVKARPRCPIEGTTTPTFKNRSPPPTPGPTQAAIQQLGAGQSLTDRFTAVSREKISLRERHVRCPTSLSVAGRVS
jgi:hypothetical protein